MQNLSNNQKRPLEDEGLEGETQEHKRRHTVPENTNIRDDDGISVGSDIERLFVETDDEEDTEVGDDEPEQGPVLWSEDQEEYPPCAIYHADVKQYQARITGFADNIVDQLSKVCHRGGDMGKLRAEAVACQRFPESKKIVIALMGDAGSGMLFIPNDSDCADRTPGKSSLINSILDTPHVSQEVFRSPFAD
ncbi:unnamed protein product [Aureobasidium vineae]|uniref:Uncharacterized protein n=1 Tax=Aureobasidium vineae TaxID=2773715 RepID=A0A9N8PFS4_9PEZI|nr:unnamed protein product [Aureobasidium vineae]